MTPTSPPRLRHACRGSLRGRVQSLPWEEPGLPYRRALFRPNENDIEATYASSCLSARTLIHPIRDRVLQPCAPITAQEREIAKQRKRMDNETSSSRPSVSKLNLTTKQQEAKTCSAGGGTRCWSAARGPARPRCWCTRSPSARCAPTIRATPFCGCMPTRRAPLIALDTLPKVFRLAFPGERAEAPSRRRLFLAG